MSLLSKLFGKKNVAERNGEPTMVYVPNDDDRMKWAIEKARLTLWYFEENLKNPTAQQGCFSVKVQIMDGDVGEHIWLIDPSFDEYGNLFGIVGNEPVSVKTVKIDQKIGVNRDFISDWMTIEDGRLIGGYTTRAIRDGIPAGEKSEFDKSLGLYIDEGIDHFKVDFETPEGAILSIEQAYRNKDLKGVLSCKDFTEEAKIILSKLHMKLDNEILETTAELLELSFIKGLKENGFPDFSDLKCAFPTRENLDDTHYIITEVCWFPAGGKSVQKLNTYKSASGWKVLGPVD